jgi:hypothetical protein
MSRRLLTVFVVLLAVAVAPGTRLWCGLACTPGDEMLAHEGHCAPTDAATSIGGGHDCRDHTTSPASVVTPARGLGAPIVFLELPAAPAGDSPSLAGALLVSVFRGAPPGPPPPLRSLRI